MIHIFNRQCYQSKTRPENLKFRPDWFSKEKCYDNLLTTSLDSRVLVHTVYDEFYGSLEETFLAGHQVEHIVSRGTESGSFLETLDFALSHPDVEDDDVVYLVEDDYIHIPGWVDVLLEVFSIPAVSYATLYDHGDKYSELYPNFRPQIFFTDSCHWLVTPSTTNTFATRVSTLREDQHIHRYFSENFEPTNDHEKFLELGRIGRHLVSALPGYSTHCNTQFMAPTRDWERYINA